MSWLNSRRRPMDPALRPFCGSVAVLRDADGEVAGHVATQVFYVVTWWESLRTQEKLYYLVTWADGSQEAAEHDPAPDRPVMRGLLDGRFTLWRDRYEREESYPVERLSGPAGAAAWERFGFRDFEDHSWPSDP